jgi:hypothetical protein
LQVAIGPVLTAVRGPGAPGVFEAFYRGRQLCDELNHPDRLLPILSGQCLYQYARGDLQKAHQLAEELQHLGERRDDTVIRFTACRASGSVRLLRGEFAAARAYLKHGLAIYDPAQRPLLAVPIAAVDPLVDVVATIRGAGLLRSSRPSTIAVRSRTCGGTAALSCSHLGLRAFVRFSCMLARSFGRHRLGVR